MDRRNYRPRYLFNDPVIRGEEREREEPVTTALMSTVKRKLRIGYEYGLYVSMRANKRWKINRE